MTIASIDLPTPRAASALAATDTVEVSRAPGALAVRATKLIDVADPYMEGHFPDFTIYPGVFLLETVVQAAATALEEPAEVAAVRSMRFTAPLRGGERLSVEAIVIPAVDGVGWTVAASCRRPDGSDAATIKLELVRVGTHGLGDYPEIADLGPAVLGVDGIRRLLPHGHPMLLVDRVLALEPGASIVATKAITAGEPCYRELARELPRRCYAYPPSLLLESFGQAAALLWLLGEETGLREDIGLPEGVGLGDDQVLMLVAARDCRIEGCALPGEVLRHVGRIDHVVGQNVFVTGETYVGSRLIATVGSMMAAMRPRRVVDPGARAATPPVRIGPDPTR